uniref:Uncharacterized protein n=1 Tax=Rhizophora mucronata TaxID=61149 RepID=A0A2P2QL83_RHIMU
MDSTKRVAKANQEQEGRQVLSPSSSGRRSRSSASNSPEFEFWMVRNPSFPQPNLVSADELFVDGVLLPLHLLHPSNHHQHQHHHHHQRQQPDPPDPLPGPPTSLPDPEPEISPASITAAEPTTTNTSSLTSSKRWRDILFNKKGEKKTGSASGTGKKNQEDKDRDKDREKKREKKCHSRGSSSAELNIINIWPFSRSRSAGNSGFRPRLFPAAGTRKASSAPCSRSNSAGESKSSRKWPSSPGRPGVHLGRSSPVWQVRRSGGSNSNVRSNGFQFNHHDPLLGVGGRSGEKGPGKKEATEPRRSKSSNSCGGGGGSNNDGAGGGGSKVKAKALKMNVPPMCDGYRNQLSCGNEENSTIGVDGRSNRGGVKNGNTGRSGNNSNYLGNGNGNGGHIFNLRTLFSKKKGLLMV